ncbi:uncharacterized protein [Spinacia oleracea]|uniref:Retrotransposon Copia-like N-terminal domain-containing protein n=1 Tax=Spinacia oleracea TaxID=3562 RepID=A0ABM3R7W4_SPIOL|nr:uncharacterized protein LOC130467257 [Spinacia oleracea]
MAGGEASEKKAPQLIHDTSSIYFLHPSEGPGMSITKCVLLGENYDVWSKAIMNGLEGKNKLGFLTGDIARPTDETSPEFIAWRSNNSTICGWIFNSLHESLQSSVVSHRIATEFWADLKERYATTNGPKIHQLKNEYHTLRQKGATIVTFHNKFTALWDALYGSKDLTCGCTCEAAAKLRLRVEQDRTHDFLMGLDDDDYGAIRTQILSMEPLPNLNRAFSLVTQEERHRNIVRARDVKTEATSFAVQASPTSESASRPITNPPLHCTYCDRNGHEYEFCYKRIGFPQGGTRGRGRGRKHGACGDARGDTQAARGTTAIANSALAAHLGSDNKPSTSAMSSSLPGFSTDQLQRLKCLLEASPPSDKLHGKIEWLLDSGASHHMTANLESLFYCVDITPSPVSLPDGVHTTATKQGSVTLVSGLILRNVLFVPQLKCN